jgi:rhomboid protease GluP
MEDTSHGESAPGPWEAFVLGMLAPLGPCPLVHLAPKIPPDLLSSALRTYLPLENDELLLALFDGGADRLEGCCALTTRRVYWVRAQSDESPNGPSGEGAPRVPDSVKVKPEGESKPICLVSAYAVLADTIVPVKADDGTVQLHLGVGQPLLLRTSDLGVGQLLARYLEKVGAAARLGVVPSLAAIDPDIAERVARVLPAVARVSRQARTMNLDLLQFRSTLLSATPHMFVTSVLMLSCVAVFVAMLLAGVPPADPSASALLDWGANQGAHVLLRHEYWRLFTSVFVHGGWIHLAVNMWCLSTIGPLVERLYGNLAYLVIYLAAGIGGAIASAVTPPPRPSVGASGAIFGVLGALLSFLIIHRRSIPASVLKPLRGSAVGFVVFNTIFGLVVTIIDQAAHMGGLVTGFVGGLLLSRPWPAVRSGWVTLRRAAMTVLCVALLALSVLAATHKSEILVSPSERYADVVEQLGPLRSEFDAIGDQISKLDLWKARDNGVENERCRRSVAELIDRGTRNLVRIRKTATPDEKLRELAGILLRAQSHQIDCLQAVGRYLEIGAIRDLEGAIQLQKTATEEAENEFRIQQLAYRRDHGLIRE